MKKILTLSLIMTFFVGVSHAKWWIFGKSNDDVEIKYLTINSISVEESGKKITLFKDMLPDGKINIKGRAYAGRNQIGSVRISLDDKSTWQDVKTADNGAFEYSFMPEQGKKYVFLIEATDTAGKVNKVEETRKELELSDESVRSKITDILNAMFEAYNKEDQSKFMSFVSENFAGDKAFLELAVKKDFNALSNINMRYTINNIASGSGKIFVSINFNRMVFVNKTGQSYTDNGMTEFVFEMDGGKPKLYSMKQPLVFGLSDADNVATGEVIGNTVANLVLDDTGNLSGSETISLSCSGTGTELHPLYYFSTREKGCHNQTDMIEKLTIGEFIIYPTQGELQQNGQVKEFNKSLSSLTSAEVKNLTGYTQPVNFNITIGKSYGIYIHGKFYAVEFISLPAADGRQNTSFKLKAF